MPALRTALATVHRDREWWWKMLIGGALWLTVIGYPIVEGYQIESIENTKNGFPTPLPRWNDPGTKAVQGIFALVIDFFYFAFPLLIGGGVLLCGALGLSMTSSGPAALRVIVGATSVGVAGWWVAAWALSVSPIGKRLLVDEGQPNQALSSKVVRLALAPEGRASYFTARALSLPLYLVPLGALAAAWQVINWSGWLALLLVWVGLAALLDVRLVVVQLYAAAAREEQQRRFEALRARSRT